MRFLFSAMLVASLSGCMNELAQKQYDVRIANYDSQKLFLVAAKSFVKGSDEIAAKKFVLEKTVVDQDWKSWLERHTDESGGLVSTDPTGKVVPMPVTQLLAAMDKRNTTLVSVAAGEANWRQYRELFTDAIAKADSMNEVLKKEEFDVMEAQKSGQAFIDATLTALGSVAGGMGIGILAF